MLEGREETVSGPVTLTKDRTIIRKGVSMLRVDGPGGQLQIYDRKARAFDAGSAKAVRTVYGFIVGYEV